MKREYYTTLYCDKKYNKPNYIYIFLILNRLFNTQNITDQKCKRKHYLDTGLYKIHEVLLFCRNQYDCQSQILNRYYLWNDDNVPSPCLKCDNCRNRIKEKPTCINDICHLLEIVEEMNNNNFKITEDDIVEVFCKSNTKKIRKLGLIELEVYKSGRKPKFGKPKELAGYMIADLVIRNYIQQKTSLYYSSPNAQTLSASIFITGLIAEAKIRIMEDS